MHWSAFYHLRHFTNAATIDTIDLDVVLHVIRVIVIVPTLFQPDKAHQTIIIMYLCSTAQSLLETSVW